MALFIFEVGSAVCGSAPNSVALIIGRAIAGRGGADLLSEGFITIAHITPIEQRLAIMGIGGSMFGIASMLGPLIGSAFIGHVTWRRCFYINLPLGALAAAMVIPTLHIPRQKQGLEGSQSIVKTFWMLDPVGTVLFMASVICLLLALQWGGTTYSWNNGKIIAILVLFAVFLLAFVALQLWLGESATVPPHIARQRTVASGSLSIFFVGANYFLFTCFIPIWFQAVKGVSALTSGIHTIPLVLSQVVAIIISGGVTTKLGHYMPFVFGSVVLASTSSGLITTWIPDTSIGRWIGFQILYGIGCGFGFQIPTVAPHTVLALEDVAIGMSVTVFSQIFGGTLFVSMGINVFNNALVDNIAALQIPAIDPKVVIDLGATQLRSCVPLQYIAQAISAYNQALVRTFQVALICACLSILGVIGMEWRSVQMPAASIPEGHEDQS